MFDILKFNIYFTIGNPSFYSAIRKMNPDDTFAWMTGLSFKPIVKSLQIDPQKQNIYLAYLTNPQTTVVRLDTSSGGIVDSYSQ